MKKLVVFLVFISFSSAAQKMKIIGGNLHGLKDQASYAIKFSYDSITVGRGVPEKDYLEAVSIRWDAKEHGKGDAFVKMWFDDRSRLYEPTFMESFEKASGIKVNDPTARYTLVFKTYYIEGGWDAGIEGSNAIIAGEFWIVESGDSSKVKAKISVRDSQGNNNHGGDFEMTTRIKSAYASAGKWLGIYMQKHSR